MGVVADESGGFPRAAGVFVVVVQRALVNILLLVRPTGRPGRPRQRVSLEHSLASFHEEIGGFPGRHRLVARKPRRIRLDIARPQIEARAEVRVVGLRQISAVGGGRSWRSWRKDEARYVFVDGREFDALGR